MLFSSSPMLHSLRPAPGSRPQRKRVARGNSGKGGTTAGRGTKGQQSRTGKGRNFGFEGGQTPLIRRQPKLGGFRSPRKIVYETINLSVLEQLPEGTYALADLADRRLVRANRKVKILGNGTLTKKIVLEAHAASKVAKKAIADAGGSLTIVRG
jgi:large subunit ribosomal protein L15